MKPNKLKGIIFVFVIALAFWLFDAMVDVVLFWKPSMQGPDFKLAVHAAYMDLISLLYLVVFGLVILRYMRKFNDSEVRYEQLFNSIDDLIYIQAPVTLDNNRHFVEANAAAYEKLGYDRREFLQLSPASIIPAEKLPEQSKNVQELLDKGHLIYETSHRAKDGREIPEEINAHVVTLRGRPAILSIARDITWRKQGEAALIRAKEEWESTFDAVPDLIAIIDKSHRIVRVNRAMAAALGVEREELAGRACHEIMHDCSAPPPFCPHSLLLADGQEHAAEVHDLDRDFLVSASPLYGRQGDLIGGVHVARDITELKRTQEVLRESEARFRAIFERSELSIAFFDLNGRILSSNPAAVRHLGYSTEELIGRHFREISHRDDLEKDLELFAELTSGRREYYKIEKRYIRKNGEVMWCLKIVSLVRDPEGKPQFVIAMLEDTTTRKRAEEALQEAHHQLEQRVEARTRELAQVNLNLQREVAERTQAEAALRESEQQLRLLTAQILSAEETVRQRIAQELHDELGQNLMILKFKLSAFIDSACPKKEEYSRDYEILFNYLDGVIANIRRLSRDLSSSVLEELGLASALRYLLGEFVNHFQIASSSIEIDEIDQLFPPETQINIYRIFQEILTNIARHAQARSIAVAVTKHDDYVAFVVQDDGKGFDMKQIASRKPTERRIGLAAMEERARIIGGSLEIWSQEGSGTRVTFNIPIKRAEL